MSVRYYTTKFLVERGIEATKELLSDMERVRDYVAKNEGISDAEIRKYGEINLSPERVDLALISLVKLGTIQEAAPRIFPEEEYLTPEEAVQARAMFQDSIQTKGKK